MTIKINGKPFREYIRPGAQKDVCTIPIEILREVMRLKDEEDKNFIEIARIMGCSRGASYYRYHRAKKIVKNEERV